MPKHYATLDGLKRAATKLKRRSGMSHSAALEQIARGAGFPHFHAAMMNFAAGARADPARARRPQYPITILEAWADRERRMRGTESRTFLMDMPLSDLVKPHHLTGYLSGCRLGAADTLTGYGDSDSRKEARFQICRLARTLQFMAATGLRPSDSGRCYPKGRWDNHPPGADHDQGWYHPATRSYVLTEEPYFGHLVSYAAERTTWAKDHGWKSTRARWDGIYGQRTELHLSGSAKGGVNVAALARRLAKLPSAFSEADWPEDGQAGSQSVVPSMVTAGALAGDPAPAVEIIEMSPEMSEAFRKLREREIVEAGPQAPEATVAHLGVTISSRWSIAHELDRMRAIITAMPQDLRERVETMWCDSNAQAFYNVAIAPGAWVEGISHGVREAVLEAADGFNGLVIEGDGHSVAFDPEWGDDDGFGFPEEAFL